MDQDINQAFEDILLCENRISQNAYESGFTQGKSQGNIEGYHLGYHRGAELGAELGYYLGIVLTNVSKDEGKPKVYAQLLKLKNLIETFPKTNDENCDILEKMDEIRALYKRCCSLMKVDGKFPEMDKMNF